MRILYLVPDLFGVPGGIARYCRLVARALTETPSVRLDVLALNDTIGTPADLAYLRGLAWSYTPFGARRLAFAAAAASRVLVGNYDVLMSGHVNFSGILHAAPLRRDRRITFIYGVDAWRRLPWHRRWFLQRASVVVAISEHTARRAAATNDLLWSNVRILHNCLDPQLAPSEIDATASGSPALSESSILTVARMSILESSKGHANIIRALPEVRQRVPEARYYIVGEGDQKPILEVLARDMGVSDSVEFLGRVSDAALKSYYESCALFAMPSKTEGFGFVFLEAMAYGRPVLAGNQDAGPEVSGDNEAGLLVDPDDRTAIADSIVRILSDQPLQQRLGRAGLQRVSTLFNYERFRQNLRELVAVEPKGGKGAS